jgi:hypothetical protein
VPEAGACRRRAVLARGRARLDRRRTDRTVLVSQLVDRLRASLVVAGEARDSAALETREGATPAEKRDDARAAIEHGSVARRPRSSPA